jgi:hypothetical protein
MQRHRFKLGDRVLFDGDEFIVEEDHGNGVYQIGNADDFVEMALDDELDPINCAACPDNGDS